MPDIIRSAIPTFYEVGLVDHSTVCIRVLRSVLEEIAPKLATYSNPRLEEEYGLPGFIGIQNEVWGYGGKLVRTDDGQNDWRIYHCLLPIITGPTMFADHREANCVSASLSVFFRQLNNFKGITGWPRPQLVQISMRPPNPLTMGVDLSGTMCEWVKQEVSRGTERVVQEAMIQAYDHMHSRDDNSHLNLQAWFRSPDSVDIAAGGVQACTMFPDERTYKEREAGQGYALTVSNLDSVSQQLMFLIAIAKMCDLAREAGY